MNARPLFCTLLLVATASAQALPAFPGAEGGGAESVGGRGGVICEVTNLNDSGPGSLRACAQVASGPRIVVFRVGGTIQLLTDISIENPYITIAGQTAPGGGITLGGKNSGNHNVIGVKTHNVIIRNIRVRKGFSNDPSWGTGIHVFSGPGVIIDHCSVSWSISKNIAIWTEPNFPVATNVTISWNLVADGIGPLARNVLTGAATSIANNMVNIDTHHNLFANSYERNPLVKVKSFRLVNNLIYNWSRTAVRVGGGANLDVIGNLFKAGPLNGTYNTGNPEAFSVYEIQEYPTEDETTPSGSPSIYVAGNIGPHNTNPDNDNWQMVRQVASGGGTHEWPPEPPVTKYRRYSPLPILPVPITINHVSQLESMILPVVGASRRLDCMGNWVSNRDEVDTRIINEYNTNRGTIKNTEAEMGDFPVLASGTPCTDSDHDGMPDAWEDANGLNKNNPADGRAIHSSGYSNVERYLNGSSASGPSLTLLEPTGLRIL